MSADTDTETEYVYSTTGVATKLGCSSRTVVKRAKAAGVGINISGRAGMRFSEADVQVLVANLRPVVDTAPRRRRRRTAVRG